jgi:hypothetical protein
MQPCKVERFKAMGGKGSSRMEELSRLPTRVQTRYDAASELRELRLRQQAEAGVMWAQGLFASCAQARAHFGIGIEYGGTEPCR